MRIISGNHKGKKIQAPKSLPVRPTTDRAKESIFNILENRYNLSEKRILDLFSGTGNLSYEFSSRNTFDFRVMSYSNLKKAEILNGRLAMIGIILMTVTVFMS